AMQSPGAPGFPRRAWDRVTRTSRPKPTGRPVDPILINRGAPMQATEAAIRQVVQEVLSQLGRSPYLATAGKSRDGAWGVFKTVDQAVQAATDGFDALSKRGLEDRRQAIDCVRRITAEQADELGRLELEETKIGRLDHKIEKLKIVKLVPGVEFLRTDAMSGDHGIMLTEYAPFGVIGAITPVTHSLPTLAGNVVNMLAGWQY